MLARVIAAKVGTIIQTVRNINLAKEAIRNLIFPVTALVLPMILFNQITRIQQPAAKTIAPLVKQVPEDMATVQNLLKNHPPVVIQAPVKVMAMVARVWAPISRLTAPRTKEAQMSRLAVRKHKTCLLELKL